MSRINILLGIVWLVGVFLAAVSNYHYFKFNPFFQGFIFGMAWTWLLYEVKIAAIKHVEDQLKDE